MLQTPANAASSTGGTEGHLTAKRCLFVMALAFGNSSPYTSCSSSPGPTVGRCAFAGVEAGAPGVHVPECFLQSARSCETISAW